MLLHAPWDHRRIADNGETLQMRMGGIHGRTVMYVPATLQLSLRGTYLQLQLLATVLLFQESSGIIHRVMDKSRLG